MRYRKTAIALAAALTVALSAASPVSAAHWHGGGWHGGGWHHGGGWGWGGAAAGFAAGALIGSAAAAGPYYGAPYYYGGYGYAAPYPYDDYDEYDAPYGAAPAYGGGGDDAYCAQRFKSYDPSSGTYLGYDGARHPCP